MSYFGTRGPLRYIGEPLLRRAMTTDRSEMVKRKQQKIVARDEIYVNRSWFSCILYAYYNTYIYRPKHTRFY